MSNVDETKRSSGYVPFGKYQTWYTLFGDLRSTSIPPLIALHGGPAAGHDYLLPLGELYGMTGIPVILYDQVGCGRSTHLPEEPATTFTIDFFVEELQNLLQHLDIRTYDLLGHSWGGMLACEHVVRGAPGLRKLILAGCPASTEAMLKVVLKTWKDLPEKYYQAMLQHEKDQKPTEDYDEASRLYLVTYVCRLDPVPEGVLAAVNNIFADRVVNDALWGTGSDLLCTGTLKNWTIADRLASLDKEILLTTGEYDYCGGEAMEPFLTGNLNLKFFSLPNAGHMPHLDSTEKYLKQVAEFLKGATAV